MSSSGDENNLGKGFSITYETIAKGAIRPKVKIWFDDHDIDKGIIKSAELYTGMLTKMRNEGFVIDGDNK